MKSTYDKYLKSGRWKELRNQAIARDGCCRLCGSHNRLEVHHIRYAQINGEELLSDLTTLCQKCHAMFHKCKAKVNKISKKQKEISKKYANITTFNAGIDAYKNAIG